MVRSGLLPLLLVLFPLSGLLHGEDVAWQELRGVVVSGTTVTKSGIPGWGNAGASSVQAILAGDGVFEFSTTEATTDKICGLARQDRDQQYEPIEFGIWLSNGGGVGVVEKGTIRGWFGTYQAGDRLQVAIEGGTVRYRINGTLLYSSTTAPVYPLLADAALSQDDATIVGATITGSSRGEAVRWTNTVTVTTEANGLRKSGTSSSWASGAVSTRGLSATGGHVEFTATETNTQRIVGLSAGDSGASDADIDFGLYLYGDGTVRILEGGLARTNASGSVTFGSYLAGDRFRVSVESGQVRYRKNGALLYTSAVAPTYPLLVDTAFYTPGASIADGVLSGPLVDVGVEAPELAMTSGTAATGFDVLISTRTPGATVRYTLNGNDPTESDAAVSASVVFVSPGTTLKARGFKGGVFPSRVVTRSYGEWSALPIQDVFWTNVVGVAVNGNSLTKSAGTVAWDAGAVSTRSVISGDAYVEFTVAGGYGYRVCGFGGGGDTNQRWDDVAFGISLLDTGGVVVVEGGNLVPSSGTPLTNYVNGDRFRVSIENGQIKYGKNGVVFLTSALTPTYPLLVDTALYTPSMAINNVKIAGTVNTPPPPTVAINDVSLAEGNTVTPSATFTVSLSAPFDHLVTLDYATADGTAVAASDYVAASGTVSFHPGETTKTIAVTVNGDITIEPNETFVVNLSNAVGVTIADAQGQATITNDDSGPGALTCPGVIPPGTVFTTTVTGGNASNDWVAMYPAAQAVHNPWIGPYRWVPLPRPTTPDTFTAPASPGTYELRLFKEGDYVVLGKCQFVVAAGPLVSITDGGVLEGNFGTMSVSVTLSLSLVPNSPVTVGFATANDTAAAGSDYVASSGTVTFAPGETTKTVTFTTNGDAAPEPNETFFVNLTNAVGATIADPQAVVRIIDDDSPANAIMCPGSVAPGTTFTPMVNGGNASNDWVAMYPAAQAANNPWIGPYRWVPVPRPAMTDSFTAPASPGTYELRLFKEGDYVVLGKCQFVVATGPLVSIADGGVLEGNFGTANVSLTLTLSTASSTAVTVDYATANGTATAATDYVAAAGTVTFAPGETTKTIVVAAKGDTAAESMETFVVDLAGAVGATIADTQGLVRIVDDDGPAGTIVCPGSVAPGATFTPMVNGGNSSNDWIAMWPAGVGITLPFIPPYRRAPVPRPAPTDGTFTAPTSPGVYELRLFANNSNSVVGTCQFVVAVGAGPTPTLKSVVWTNAVGVTVTGNSLQKSTSVDGWDAGAVSTKAIASADGYVEFTATETNNYRMFGLSHGNTDVTYPDIDYAVFLVSDGTVQIYEAGVNRGSFGAYASGDVFRVAVEAGVVRYRRNGNLIYTSTIGPTYPLLVDTSLYRAGATITNAKIFGVFGPNQVPIAIPGGPYEGIAGAPIPFDGRASNDPDGTVVSYAWEFGDGATATGATPSHAYVSTGLYTARLTVTDDDGASSSVTAAVVVTVPRPVLNVVWTQVVQATASGNNLTKVSSADAWDAGAVSMKSIVSGNGYVEFTATETNNYRMCGLSHGNGGVTYQDIDYAFFLVSDGSVQVYEAGVIRGNFGTYVSGDVFRVAVESGVVRYRRNGSLIYTSTVAPTYPLLVDTSLYRAGATITNAKISGVFGPNQVPIAIPGGPYEEIVGAPILFDGRASNDPDGTVVSYAWEFGDGATATGATPSHAYASTGSYTARLTVTDDEGASSSVTAAVVVTVPRPVLNVVWTQVVQATASGNNLTKVSSADAWDAGAVSTNWVVSGNGYVEFTATETNNYRMCGLSHGNTDVTYPDIDYAFFLVSNGTVQIYEAGVNRGSFGTYASGDVFRVAVESGVVRYRRNGSLLYTSTITPTYPLLVDTSLYRAGATITNAKISGVFGPNQVPIAIAGGPYFGSQGEVVSMSGSASTGTGLTYKWSFGDGQSATGMNASHSYASGGTYTATLTVTDSQGLFAIDTAQVSVAAVESVVWTHVVGAVASGNSLEKTATPGWNAGAISVDKIGAGDGYMEFSAGNAAQVGYIGLGNGDSGQGGSDIEYAFRLGTSQSLSVYESGVLRGTYGTYAPSDRLRVAVESGTVKYSRNGTVVYTSAVHPTYSLTVDTALHDTGATVSNVQIAAASFTSSDLPSGTTTKTPTDFMTPAGMAPGSPAGSYALSGFETVDLFSGNLNVALPLRAIKGRGDAGYDMILRLERNWAIQRFDVPREGGVFDTFYFPHDDIWSMVGGPKETPYAAGFGMVRYHAEPGALCAAGVRQNASITRVVFMLADGTSHDLFGTGDNAGLKTTTCASPGEPFNRGRDFVSRDGFGLYFRSDTDIIDGKFDVASSLGTGGATGDLVTRDGTRYRLDDGRVSSIRDRNGNLISFSYPPVDILNPGQPPNQVGDSLGRVTHIDAAETCTGDRLTFAGSGGATRTINICRTSLGAALAAGQGLRTLGELFPEIADRFQPGYPPPTTVYDPLVVSRVELPDGRQYTFQYTSFARVAAIVLPTGGRIEYDYAPTDVNLGSLSVRQRVAERRMIGAGGGLEQRIVYSPASGGTSVSTRDGGGNELVRETHAFFGDPDQPPAPGLPTNYGKEFRTEVFQGGTLLRRTEHDWGNDSGTHDFAIVEERVSVHDGPAPLTARKTFAYDGFTNRISTTELDFDGTAVRRRCTLFVTDPSYTSFPTHLISLPSREVVYQGQSGGAACAGDGVARTSYTYDAAALADRPGISGHDGAYGTARTNRGNPTSIQRLVGGGEPDSIARYRYDVAGNVTRSIDPRGFATDIEYDGPSFAFPTRVTNALGHQSRASFDFDTGQRIQQRDLNGVTTDFEYDDALDRLTTVVAASNDDDARTRTRYTYLDDERIVRTASDLRHFGDGALTSESEYDGFGRVVATRQETPDGPTTVETTYDGLGRVSQVANPHRSEPAAFTTTSYDALGRVRVVQAPDGAHTVTTYSGAEATVTDPVGNARRSRSDALGRVVRVVEAPGQANLTTDYTYDVLDNLRLVNQGAQTRTFTYDALSRLKTASNPESGVTSYPLYDAGGNLTRRVDARGVQTNYDYDELGRIRSRSYSGGAGVAATDSVTYSYDQGGSHSIGRLTGVVTNTSQTTFSGYDALGRVVAHSQRTNGRFYDTAYEYNRAGLLTGETYPSGRSISIQYDDAGRISGVTGSKPLQDDLEFVTPGDVSYSPHGAIAGMRLGNGLWESTDFNQRLQPTAIRLGTGNGGDDRLRLGYTYHPPGPASANNGNVYEQRIFAAGAQLVQTYAYDGLNRLSSAGEQRGGTVWDQTYSYDAFGNRRVSSGYVPNTNLTPTSPAHIDHDTNRLLMGTAYDGAGNLTRDPVGRLFTYDGENRQTKFLAGPTGLPVNYGYDGDGRRVFKKETAGHTFVYIYDAMGRLVTEHSDEDPALPAKDYVYAGSRLVAEVKGSIPGGGLGLIGPVGIVDNCAVMEDFDFKWYRDSAATHYKLKVDDVEIVETLDAKYCVGSLNNRTICVFEPEAQDDVQPFAPGPHHWAVLPLYDGVAGVWSPEFYYVIGPPPANPVSPAGTVNGSPTTFRWTYLSLPEQYRLFIDAETEERAHFPPSTVCAAGECTATVPPLNLPLGKHSWRIHGVFAECEVSSLRKDFNIDPSACAATPISPHPGAFANLPLVFGWSVTPGVSNYQLDVIDPQGGTYSWRILDCLPPVCTITEAQRDAANIAVHLAPWRPGNGLHRWKVYPYGSSASACAGWTFWVTGVPPAVCEGTQQCGAICNSDLPCDTPCIDPELNTLTTCSGLNRPCDPNKTCSSTCQALGGTCGTCSGSAVLGHTADCGFATCCNTATDTCAQRAHGWEWQCPQGGAGCARGFDPTGPSADCGECCVAVGPGPSCGAIGGDHCGSTGTCPNGYPSLGQTFDCEACCDAPPPGSEACSTNGSCNAICSSSTPCDASCLDPESGNWTSCGQFTNGGCASAKTCTLCSALGGACGQCSGDHVLGRTPDCGFETCCGDPYVPPPTCTQAGGYCLGSCTGSYTPLNGTCSSGGLTCCAGPAPQTCSERGGTCRPGDSCPTGQHPDFVATDCPGDCCVQDDVPPPPPPECGNGVCKPNVEDCGVCLEDCPCPGNLVCNASGSHGQCVNPPPPPPQCGDGVCAPGVEDCGTCIQDCPCPGNKVCNASGSAGQCVNPPPACGDGVCAPGVENCGTCLQDCPCPGNKVCNGGQCVNPGPQCGDGTCAPGVENCGNCAEDCPCAEGLQCNGAQCVAPEPYCGDGTCAPGIENCGWCPDDCPCAEGLQCSGTQCVPSGQSAALLDGRSWLASTERLDHPVRRDARGVRPAPPVTVARVRRAAMPVAVSARAGDLPVRRRGAELMLAVLAFGLVGFLRSRGMKKTALLIILVLLGSQVPSAAQSAKKREDSSPPVAQIGDRTITDDELERLASNRLAKVKNEEYNIKRQVLEEYITRALIETEAAARGISPEELEKREIEQKVMPVTEEQKRAVYESNPQPYAGKSEAEAFALIEANLKRIRLADARRRLLASIRSKTSVKVLLEAPRVEIAAVDGATMGPKTAPVTIVEFSDFQCPYCARAQPILKDLMQRYDGKVRLVFRDFPLDMHAQAQKAAEAARCAGDQGKFWEMHDRLFTDQRALQVADLKRSASELGLDTAKFNTCVDSGRYAAALKADMDAGARLGVNATPTFFVNGRMITGAGSPQAFTEVIDQELARAGKMPTVTAGASR